MKHASSVFHAISGPRTKRQAGQAYNACNFRQAAGPPKMLVGEPPQTRPLGLVGTNSAMFASGQNVPKLTRSVAPPLPTKSTTLRGPSKDCLRHRSLPRLFLMRFTA